MRGKRAPAIALLALGVATACGRTADRTQSVRGGDSASAILAGVETVAESASVRGSANDSAPPSIRYDQHIFAGGMAPPGAQFGNPFRGDLKSAAEGEQLFTTMNCDGCHGGGGTGWVGPSLSDGRWRYGGADAAVFTSIFYGRPEGMPAYGGVLAAPLAWKIVTYLNSLPRPKSVPTQAW